MNTRKILTAFLIAGLAAQTSPAMASDEDQRVYEREFFDQFAPQNALEMIERLPGFTLQEADEARGLGQGGTNVLIDGRPVTGKGETATTRISQISANSVLRIEVLNSDEIDVPGFSGLIANIITRQTSVSGSIEWEPNLRRNAELAYGNGSITVSGSSGDLSYSALVQHTMVRVPFTGPETITDASGSVFETRDETFLISGNQPDLSGSVTWSRPNGHVWNAKASFRRLDITRRQDTLSTAITPRGRNGIGLTEFTAIQDSFRFDTDYSLPALGGDMKVIVLARHATNDALSQLTSQDAFGNGLSNQTFEEDSVSQEGVLRIEQQWNSSNGNSWQIAAEGAVNSLDLDTDFRTLNPINPGEIIAQRASTTKIKEQRGEATLVHRRRLSAKSNLQVSVGGELSQIRQGDFVREFFRPKGFASYTLQPSQGWTLVARIDRKVGQIKFRDFAATVSLFDGAASQDNIDLVPQQSWLLSGRAERVFNDGHVAKIDVAYERIADLVDRIPIGADGDAVGNIPSANRWGVEASLTLIGKPFGLPGAQLDLSGSWQWSSLEDPIEGFNRDIGNLKKRDMRIRFRHDLPSSDISYGFEFQDRAYAPVYRSTFIQTRNVPGGALTPGTNAVFVEHKDLFGFRARLQLSEFLGQSSRFKRVIYSGRRDNAPIDRIESRARSLNGPVITLGLVRSF